ncbi:MAG: hypothetical protein JJ979_21425 [Roseibium sp.]|nr:hypothetical protein [Roseibium sp.]
MEIGFYHPDRGYWQASGRDPREAILRYEHIPSEDGSPATKKAVYIADEYPSGTIEVPLKPGPHYEWVGGKWVYAPPSAEEVRAQMGHLLAEEFRLALLEKGWTRVEVEAAISRIADDRQRERAEIKWEYGTIYYRTDEFIKTLFEMLVITPEEADAIWMSAFAEEGQS